VEESSCHQVQVVGVYQLQVLVQEVEELRQPALGLHFEDLMAQLKVVDQVALELLQLLLLVLAFQKTQSPVLVPVVLEQGS